MTSIEDLTRSLQERIRELEAGTGSSIQTGQGVLRIFDKEGNEERLPRLTLPEEWKHFLKGEAVGIHQPLIPDQYTVKDVTLQVSTTNYGYTAAVTCTIIPPLVKEKKRIVTMEQHIDTNMYSLLKAAIVFGKEQEQERIINRMIRDSK